MPGRTAKYYASNPEARKKRLAYQAEYNKKDREVEKRVELNAKNRENHREGRSKVGDGKDVSHVKGGTKLQKASVNRGSKSSMPGDKRARGNGSKK
jgi:hypothetical protein